MQLKNPDQYTVSLIPIPKSLLHILAVSFVFLVFVDFSVLEIVGTHTTKGMG